MFKLAEYRANLDRLADFLPWALLIAPGTVLGKDGTFSRFYRFRGPDLESHSPEELAALRGQLNNALRRLGSRWAAHIEAFRRCSVDYPQGDFPDPVTAAMEGERRADFMAQGRHFETEYYLTLTFLPPEERMGKAEALLIDNPEGGASGVNYKEQLSYFVNTCETLVNILRGCMPSVEALDNDQAVTYLHSCVTDHPIQVTCPPEMMYLDEIITNCDFVGGFSPRLGTRYLKTVSIRGYSSQTFPMQLDALNSLAMEYRWVCRWIPLDREDAGKVLNTRKKQWFAKRKGILTMLKEVLTQEESALEDTDAVNKTLDADAALQALGADVCGFGYFTPTVTVWGATEKEAEDKARRVRQVFDIAGFVSRVEDLNAVEAWLGSLPGHVYADVRRPLISTLNVCDMIPASAIWAGPTGCKHLSGPPLLYCKTQGSTPFRLNLHHGDVGHCLIFGPTGAGKSVLLAIIVYSFRRYAGVQIYIFDKGASSRALTLAVGGSFHDLGAPDGGLHFQPLAAIDDPAERVWASEWLLDILQREGVTLEPAIKEELWAALGNLAAKPRQQRTLTLLRSLVQNQRIKDALTPYTMQGPHGYLLDADEDSLALGDGDWQAFEMETLMHCRSALIPVLAYLFHRLEQNFGARGENARPTLLVLDEAWVFLADSFFAAKIREWLKVLRKKNVAVVFATQSIADAMTSEIAPALIESCPTRIFLPNAKALEPAMLEFYQKVGLTRRQVEILSTATPKRDYYYQSSAGNRLFELGLGDIARAFCCASSKDDQQLMDEILAQGHAPGADFATSFLRARGLPDEAEVVEDLAARFQAEGDAC